MQIEQFKDIFQWVAIGLLVAVVVFWVLIAVAASIRERYERKALPKHIVDRDSKEYLDWLEKAVNRDREYGSGVNRIE